MPKLERFQSFLRLAVAAGPLLGLIGTVVGMIITFQSITESGSSDPKLMANGISQAMIATVLGLGIAMPLLFAQRLAAVDLASRSCRFSTSRAPACWPSAWRARPVLLDIAARAVPRRSLDMRELGGPVVDWIFIACVVMWCIVVERYWYFTRILPQELGHARCRSGRARAERTSWKARQIRKAMISRLNAGMSANLQVLRVLVPMAPLLGLLGTVSGMLERVRLDGRARLGRCALHGERRVRGDDLHADRPRGQHQRALPGVLLPPRACSRETERLADRFTY